MPFSKEPNFQHGQAPAATSTTAILLCNLGTPDAPTAPALRRYLAEFLSDQRVVEIPRLLWLAILHGIILRVRPKKSAAKYASIWMPEGSPLKVWTERQARQLGAEMAAQGHQVEVRYAMRYGNPSWTICSSLPIAVHRLARSWSIAALSCSSSSLPSFSRPRMAEMWVWADL